MKMIRIAVLPALVTLGNAVSGFAAIAILFRVAAAPAGASAAQRLLPYEMAGLLVFLAMVFDAIDGRIARIARATSDFGGQLDSLADAVSFGAAPALLAYRLFMELVPVEQTMPSLTLHRLAVVLAAVYFACALLRLARFNVENVHDEEAHLAFRGLPTPAAAGAVAGLVILIVDLRGGDGHEPLARYLAWALPAALLALGILMVSTVRYTHLLNQLIRGRRPLGYVIQILICIALVWFLQEKALAALFVAYAVSGPVVLLYRKCVRPRRAATTASAVTLEHKDDSLHA